MEWLTKACKTSTRYLENVLCYKCFTYLFPTAYGMVMSLGKTFIESNLEIFHQNCHQ